MQGCISLTLCMGVTGEGRVTLRKRLHCGHSEIYSPFGLFSATCAASRCMLLCVLGPIGPKIFKAAIGPLEAAEIIGSRPDLLP
jgi:hypothetical protein